MVLFVMLYKVYVVPIFEHLDKILKCLQMKATKQYFLVLLTFIFQFPGKMKVFVTLNISSNNFARLLAEYPQ